MTYYSSVMQALKQQNNQETHTIANEWGARPKAKELQGEWQASYGKQCRDGMI